MWSLLDLLIVSAGLFDELAFKYIEDGGLAPEAVCGGFIGTRLTSQGSRRKSIYWFYNARFGRDSSVLYSLSGMPRVSLLML